MKAGGGGAAEPTWIQQVAGQEEMRSVWELKPINSFKLFTPPPLLPMCPHPPISLVSWVVFGNQLISDIEISQFQLETGGLSGTTDPDGSTD